MGNVQIPFGGALGYFAPRWKPGCWRQRSTPFRSRSKRRKNLYLNYLQVFICDKNDRRRDASDSKRVCEKYYSFFLAFLVASGTLYGVIGSECSCRRKGFVFACSGVSFTQPACAVIAAALCLNGSENARLSGERVSPFLEAVNAWDSSYSPSGCFNGCCCSACRCVLGESVRATTITYDSNGFENPPFQSTDTFTAAGNGVSNRDNLHVHYDGTAGSTASIYTGTTGGINPNKTSAGTQGLQINRSVTGSNIGVTTSSFYNTNTVGNANTTTTVTTTVDINYDRAAFLPSPPAAPSTPGTGPFFGINLFGENGATGLGALGIDGTTGDIIIGNGTTFTDTGLGSVDPGSFNTFSLTAVITGTGGASAVTLSGTVSDGNPLDTVTIAPFSSTFTGTRFDYAYLWGGTLGASIPPARGILTIIRPPSRKRALFPSRAR